MYSINLNFRLLEQFGPLGITARDTHLIYALTENNKMVIYTVQRVGYLCDIDGLGYGERFHF